MASLERWEWWRWSTVLIISLALTAGLFSLAYPAMRPDVVSINQLDLTLQALLGMVLLFDAFAFYQQFKITRMRRELASQIGMLSTLEALRPRNAVEEVQRQNRRKLPRFLFDKRVIVALEDGSRKLIYGRTRDISEGGLGAVLAEPLPPETKVVLEIPVDFQSDKPLKLHAVVCYRRGFSHGFEYQSPDPADVAIIRRICSTCQRI